MNEPYHIFYSNCTVWEAFYMLLINTTHLLSLNLWYQELIRWWLLATYQTVNSYKYSRRWKKMYVIRLASSIFIVTALAIKNTRLSNHWRCLQHLNYVRKIRQWLVTHWYKIDYQSHNHITIFLSAHQHGGQFVVSKGSAQPCLNYFQFRKSAFIWHLWKKSVKVLIRNIKIWEGRRLQWSSVCREFETSFQASLEGTGTFDIARVINCFLCWLIATSVNALFRVWFRVTWDGCKFIL